MVLIITYDLWAHGLTKFCTPKNPSGILHSFSLGFFLIDPVFCPSFTYFLNFSLLNKIHPLNVEESSLKAFLTLWKNSLYWLPSLKRILRLTWTWFEFKLCDEHYGSLDFYHGHTRAQKIYLSCTLRFLVRVAVDSLASWALICLTSDIIGWKRE